MRKGLGCLGLFSFSLWAGEQVVVDVSDHLLPDPGKHLVCDMAGTAALVEEACFRRTGQKVQISEQLLYLNYLKSRFHDTDPRWEDIPYETKITKVKGQHWGVKEVEEQYYASQPSNPMAIRNLQLENKKGYYTGLDASTVTACLAGVQPGMVATVQEVPTNDALLRGVVNEIGMRIGKQENAELKSLKVSEKKFKEYHTAAQPIREKYRREASAALDALVATVPGTSATRNGYNFPTQNEALRKCMERPFVPEIVQTFDAKLDKREPLKPEQVCGLMQARRAVTCEGNNHTVLVVACKQDEAGRVTGFRIRDINRPGHPWVAAVSCFKATAID